MCREISTRHIVNDRVTTTTYDPTTLTYLTSTPAGRTTTRTIDPDGRTVSIARPSLHPMFFDYDPDGRLASVTTGTRTTEFEYFATSDGKNGYLASSIDPMGQVSSQEPDALGRPLSTTTAATTTYFDWDAAGNLTGVTPPGKPEHEQTYTAVNNLASYLPPPTADVSSPATTYTYNLDWKPTSETRPDGVTITKTYDSAGRLSQQITPTGTKTSSYYAAGASGPGVAPGKLSGIEGPTAVNLAYSYDGSLLTATTWSGDVEGVVSFGYDNSFWRVSEVVSGASGSHTATFGYDPDGLVVCVSPTTCPGSGALSFERHSGNGTVTSATSGLLTETHSVSAYGEPARHVVADGTTTLYDLTLDSTLFPRDALGRIVRKTEVVLGTTRASDYTYDALGRLTDVAVNDAVTEHYEYDPNGNRLRGVVTKNGVTTDWTGTYDAQDRLLSYGPLSFTYTANGELLTKTNADTAEVTDYTYDAFGNLRGAELPDGRLVEYLVDGQNRRVAKRIDGVTTKQWLWSSQLRIAGELDASGALTKRFLYGEKVNVPELMVDVVSGAVYRIVTDQLGSPVLVVNVADTSDVLLRAEYDAFGNRTVLSGDGDAVPFGFAGGLHDEDTGLVRFGARDYEPVVGRWVMKDPIRWEGRSVNLQAYVDNAPINAIDPTGLTKWDKLYGLPKRFWSWYEHHVKQKGDPDIGSRKEAMEHAEEWERQGRPGPDGKPEDFWKDVIDGLLPFPILIDPCQLVPDMCGPPSC